MSAFIAQQKAAGFAVELICRTLGVSRSAHYERQSGQRSARAVADERLLPVLRKVHEQNFEAYGYRKMHLALEQLSNVVDRRLTGFRRRPSGLSLWSRRR